MSGVLIFTMVGQGLILGVIEIISVHSLGWESLKKEKGVECVIFSSMGSEN